MIGIPIYDSLESIIHQCDVVLDCTMPHVSMQALECCVTHSKAFVSGLLFMVPVKNPY